MLRCHHDVTGVQATDDIIKLLEPYWAFLLGTPVVTQRHPVTVDVIPDLAIGRTLVSVLPKGRPDRVPRGLSL